ncbi:threonylcarbamoyl-AMP synthase isoform X1 [Hydra vulgaris]|uniref:threonylcarbamoyl-AMP synthase isoform X1 n=1 Tax=Hydra vulgaris TaxID=6087 RepID=UPI001F5F2DA7|nr:yrdC domain-containing protein, mitochondrial-like [Hydra vulgaris]
MERIYKLKGDNDEYVVEKAICSLNNDQVIAVPTDTIYGVAALAQSKTGVEKLYNIKNRQKEKAIAICVGSIEDVKRWCLVTISDNVLEDLLPGPVTLVFQRSSLLNSYLNPTSNSIGVRIPKCAFIQTLAQKCQQPIALTSANISSAMSSLDINEFEELWPKLDLIVDGGTLGSSEQSRLGSTVVDLTKKREFTIIREGCAYNEVVNILHKYGFKNSNK